MVYDVNITKPKHSQHCVIFTVKGICLALWSDYAQAFITPHWLSMGVHNDVLYWQPLDLPKDVPTKYINKGE
jgi:hypothetical protein